MELKPLLLVDVVVCPSKSESVLVPYVGRFFRWKVFLHATAYAAKFLDVVRKKEYAGPLTPQDIQRAGARIFREVQRDIQQHKTDYMGPQGNKMVWRFIPPRCPSMGSAWERLVGATKKGLEGLQLAKTLSEE